MSAHKLNFALVVEVLRKLKEQPFIIEEEWTCTDAENQKDKVNKGRQAVGKNNGRYIDGRSLLPRPKSTTPFEGRNGRKLNKDQVREIKIRINNKDILRVIAEDYGVKETVVKDISCGRTYSSVKV